MCCDDMPSYIGEVEAETGGLIKESGGINWAASENGRLRLLYTTGAAVRRRLYVCKQCNQIWEAVLSSAYWREAKYEIDDPRYDNYSLVKSKRNSFWNRGYVYRKRGKIGVMAWNEEVERGYEKIQKPSLVSFIMEMQREGYVIIEEPFPLDDDQSVHTIDYECFIENLDREQRVWAEFAKVYSVKKFLTKVKEMSLVTIIVDVQGRKMKRLKKVVQGKGTVEHIREGEGYSYL